MKKEDDHPMWSRKRRERREKKGDHKGQRVLREPFQPKNTSIVFSKEINIFPLISNLIAY